MMAGKGMMGVVPRALGMFRMLPATKDLACRHRTCVLFVGSGIDEINLYMNWI